MNKKIYDLIADSIVHVFGDQSYEGKAYWYDYYEASDVRAKYDVHGKLKKLFSKKIVKMHYDVTYDQIDMLFEQYYQMSKLDEYSSIHCFLLHYLSQLTTSFLTVRDGNIVVKYWQSEGDNHLFNAFAGYEKVEFWNAFSRRFTPDILVAMYLFKNGYESHEYANDFDWIIDLADNQLAGILEKGVSENHIHINAGYNFGMLWQLIHEDINLNLYREILENFNSEMNIKVRKSFLLRGLLCICLTNDVDTSQTLENYIQENTSSQAEWLKLCLMEINDGYEIVYDFGHEAFTDLKEVVESISNEHVYNEQHLLFSSLKAIASGNGLIGRIFWSYIGIKNNLYTYVTQANARSGLGYFTSEFYKKVVKLDALEENLIRNIKAQMSHNRLKKLEIRLSPGFNEQKVTQGIRLFFKVYKMLLEDKELTDIPTLGLVFHLIKIPDVYKNEKCYYINQIEEDPVFQGEMLAYGTQIKKYRSVLNKINEFRRDIDNLSYYLVGIDTASDENHTEPWVFAPVYQAARDCKESGMKLFGGSVSKLKTLGFTYHVGENYRHVISGLRHVHEVVDKLGFHAGDRIGHGISLGIDIQHWIKNNPVVFMPRIEYLENLIWLWGNSGNYFDDVPNISIEREMLKIAEEIYGDIAGVTPYILWQVYNKKFEMFDIETSRLVDFCKDKKCSEKDELCQLLPEHEEKSAILVDRILMSYHCKIYLIKMHEVIQVRVYHEEAQSMLHIQNDVRMKLNDKGIVIETNPTSNLSISGMQRLFKHHSVELNKHGLDSEISNTHGLIFTINSDDPTVFNSTVSNEIAYIFYTLLELGYSRDLALKWIDKIRKWGLETSFVDNRELSKAERLIEINRILEALE